VEETRRGDLAAGTDTVPARQRLLSAVLAVELLWLLLTAAVIVFLAAHLGPSDETVGNDPQIDRALVYVVPPLVLLVGLAILGARGAVDRFRGGQQHLGALSRLALWVTAAGNAVLAATIASSLYHAHASWMALGTVLLVAAALTMAGCAAAARRR
jgi:hypothetical protein